MKKLAVANGQYERDGQTKTRWVNVGVIGVSNGKEYMLIDPTINFAAFPRENGKDMVMVGIFDDSQQNNNQGQQPQQSYQQQPQQHGSQYHQNNQQPQYGNQNGNGQG